MAQTLQEKEASYYQNTGDELRRLIPDGAKRVLDIGCGWGLIGKKLKETGPVEVVGIEINPEAAEKAKANLDRIYLGDVETMDLDFANGYFDCVVFGDALEHMVDPWKIIAKIKGLLAKGGCIVASVPNIGHWSIIRDLIIGKWRYKDEGILDETHLRFFTLDSIKKSFEKEGFRIDAVSHRLSCHKLFAKLNKLLNGRLTHLLAWQYLLRAKAT